MTVKIKEKPSGDLAQALSRARELKTKLAAAADELNRSIAEAEAAIAALQIGVRASVVLEGDPETLWSRLLVFGKDAKGWRLLVSEGRDPIPDSWTEQPLQNASREVRLQAIKMLPALVQAMVTTAEKEIQRLEGAATASRLFVEELAKGRDQ